MGCVERLSSFGRYFVPGVYMAVLLACPLLGGLTSFEEFFYRRFHCRVIACRV